MEEESLPARRYPGHLGRVNHEPTHPVYFASASLAHLLLRLATSKTWQGAKHLPQRGAAIVVSNHISQLDPLLLGEFLIWNGRWPHFLAKSSLFDNRLLAPLLKATGQIPVYRDTAQAADSLLAARQVLSKGRLVVIYPEGTLTRDVLEWPMAAHSGAVRLALQTGAPMIPVGQWGANHALPDKKIKGWRPRRYDISICAGPPIDLTGYPATKKGIQQASAVMMAAITSCVEIARGESAPETRWHQRRNERVRPEEAFI